jgi:hypothetical protein
MSRQRRPGDEGKGDDPIPNGMQVVDNDLWGVGERATLYALRRHANESRTDFLNRLRALMPSGALADIVSRLLRSTSERTQLRTLEWLVKVNGWADPMGSMRTESPGVGEGGGGPQHAHIHLHGSDPGVTDAANKFLGMIAKADGAD